MDTREINLLRLALREMLINSIEHGNLEIIYNEKTAALDDNSYFELVARRRELPGFAGRSVEMIYAIDSKKVVYRIKDEGRGFDHQKYIDSLFEYANRQMLSHGRGLVLTRNIFDKVSYNSRDNRVLLIKHFYSIAQKN
jgi:anti-sigma regulatory factor (Ser/Thr protein kinase)